MIFKLVVVLRLYPHARCILPLVYVVDSTDLITHTGVGGEQIRFKIYARARRRNAIDIPLQIDIHSVHRTRVFELCEYHDDI